MQAQFSRKYYIKLPRWLKQFKQCAGLYQLAGGKWKIVACNGRIGLNLIYHYGDKNKKCLRGLEYCSVIMRGIHKSSNKDVETKTLFHRVWCCAIFEWWQIAVTLTEVGSLQTRTQSRWKCLVNREKHTAKYCVCSLYIYTHNASQKFGHA